MKSLNLEGCYNLAGTSHVWHTRDVPVSWPQRRRFKFASLSSFEISEMSPDETPHLETDVCWHKLTNEVIFCQVE